jgi:hypothetical protein
MIVFLSNFARRARDFTTGPDCPVVWVELHPDGLLVRARNKADRCSQMLTWEEIANVRDEVRDRMIDYAIMKAAKPIMDRREAHGKAL